MKDACASTNCDQINPAFVHLGVKSDVGESVAGEPGGVKTRSEATHPSHILQYVR
jgi:hypothetical protein